VIPLGSRDAAGDPSQWQGDIDYNRRAGTSAPNYYHGEVMSGCLVTFKFSLTGGITKYLGYDYEYNFLTSTNFFSLVVLVVLGRCL
jgi:hypothetical protein